MGSSEPELNEALKSIMTSEEVKDPEIVGALAEGKIDEAWSLWCERVLSKTLDSYHVDEHVLDAEVVDI